MGAATVNDYQGLVKRLQVPAGFDPPTTLEHAEVNAHALSRDDLADDVRGINASLDLIRRTRGGAWPTESVAVEYNYVDAVWHECEFRDGKSFTYVLTDKEGGYIGCCYLYPLGARTPLTDELMDRDVDVSWWVTTDAYARGYYERAYAAIQYWLSREYSFWTPYFSNREMPGSLASEDAPSG